MDLSGYTKDTVDAFTNALNVAKNLPGNALQSQVDEAAANLQTAMDNLEKLPDEPGSNNQDGDDGQSGENQGNNQPDGDQGQNNSGANSPDTGEVFPWAVVGILALSSVVVLGRKVKA